MKKEILIALTCLLAVRLSAQCIQESNLPAEKGLYNITRAILEKQTQNPAARGTGIRQRLTGRTLAIGGQNVDSLIFKYNGGRGSQPHYTPVNYVEYHYYPLLQDNSALPPDLQRNPPESLFDTALVYSRDINNPMGGGTVTAVVRQYVANQIIQYMSYEYGIRPLYQYWEKMVYDFNPSGQIKQASAFMDSPSGNYAPTGSATYHYSGNQLIADTFRLPSNGLSYTTQYNYNNAGNVSAILYLRYNGTAIDQQHKTLYTYNSSNQIIRYVYQNYDGQSFKDESLDSLKYTGNLLSSAHFYAMDSNSQSWMINGANIFHYNSAGSIDTYYSYSLNNGALQNNVKTVATYNTDNQLNTIGSFYWADTAFEARPYYSGRFYYEPYEAMAINAISVPKSMATLYPVPAGETLNILLKNPLQGTITICIYNSTGQIIQRVDHPATTNPAISLSGFALGSYWAEIRNGNTIQQLPFIKQ